MQQAPEKLQEHIHVQSTDYVRLERLAHHYTKFNTKQRQKTLLIVPHHKDRCMVNALVHEQLKTQGELTGNGMTITCLERQWIGNRKLASAYQIGQTIRFNQVPLHPSIYSGDYGEVVTIVSNKRRQQLTVKTASGLHDINLSDWFRYKTTDIAVFQKKSREIMVGDQLRWTRHHKPLGLVKDKTATVIAVDNTQLTVKSANGKLRLLNHQDLNACHFDYAYAQALPAEFPTQYHHVLAHLDEKLSAPERQASLLAALGAAEKHAHLYTHNETFVLSKLAFHTGEELSIDTIQDQLGAREKILLRLQDYQIENNAPRQGMGDLL